MCIHRFATSPLPNSNFVYLFPIVVLIHISCAGNNIRTCHALGIMFWLQSQTWISSPKCQSPQLRFPFLKQAAHLFTLMMKIPQCLGCLGRTWIVSKFAFVSFMFQFLALPSSCLHVLMFSLFSIVKVCPRLSSFLQQKNSILIPICVLCCLCMLRLKPKSQLPRYHRLGLGILFCMTLQSELSQMMKHWNEIGRLCVEFKGGPLCYEPLYDPQVGWKTLVKMLCSLLNSCVTLPYMAFLLFLPLFNHHHSNVNDLLSIYTFH